MVPPSRSVLCCERVGLPKSTIEVQQRVPLSAHKSESSQLRSWSLTTLPASIIPSGWVVGTVGLEPTRSLDPRILSPVRLPLRHVPISSGVEPISIYPAPKKGSKTIFRIIILKRQFSR